jgi:ribosomal protein S12 methylthiotransferase accessory factor
LVHNFALLPREANGPELDVATADLDQISFVLPHVGAAGTLGGEMEHMVGGAGADVDPSLACAKAVVEAAERYATMVFDANDFIQASAEELGERALDLGRLARCSTRELADPRCPMRLPDATKSIRWVRGISLITNREVLLPAVMVHLYLRPEESERFWVPISTGVAAHTTMVAAIASAICEVVERDAISLTWLTRRRLPRVALPAALPRPYAGFVERLAQGSTEYHFHDATTDLGIPTVILVQINDIHPTARVAVSCATAVTPELAFGGAIRESVQARMAIRRETQLPSQFADYHDLLHGASYYARGGHRGDFDFLFQNGRHTTLNDMPHASSAVDTPAAELRFLIDRLALAGVEPFAVDLTTDELRDVGLRAVRVIVPELVPLSFVHRARYLGTPRLYSHWRTHGDGPVSEENINPNPMPFA